MHAFVGADRHRPADARQQLVLSGGERLFDQGDADRLAGGEILLEIARRPGLVGIDDEFGFGGFLAHGRDPVAVAVAAELDLEQRPVRGLGGRRRHRFRGSQRDREGGGAGSRGLPSKQLPGPPAADLGFQVDQRAIQRVARRTGRQGALQGSAGRDLRARPPASKGRRPGSLPAFRHSGHRERTRRARCGRLG